MPRDSNGTYSLPAGNPVTTLTVISSTWANTTLSDVSTALTGSLDRSGQGAMLAGLKLFDGVIGAPGLTWGTETTAGIYRAGAGDFRFAIGGADVFRFATGGSVGLFGNGTAGAPAISWVSEPTSGMYRAAAGDFRWVISSAEILQLANNMLRITGTAPDLRWNESDASVDNRLWGLIATGEDLAFRVLTDAGAATNFLTVSRTAGVVDSIVMAASTISVAGAGTFTGINTFTAVGTGNPATSAIYINSNLPSIGLREADASAENRLWDILVNTEQLQFRVSNDAASVVSNWLNVDRSGTAIDTVNFPNGILQYAGNEVGYRQLPQGSSYSSTTSIIATDAGKLAFYTGGGGHTLTLGNITLHMLMLLSNVGGGSFTLAASGTLSWQHGGGPSTTGSRTIGQGALITCWHSGTGNWTVWGIGIT